MAKENATLFDLTGEVKEMYELFTEDVDPDIVNDTLEAIMGEIDKKAESYLFVIERLDMERQKAEEIEKRYSDIKKARKNAIDRLKKRLAVAMVQIGKDELPAGNMTIKLKNNGGVQPLKVDKELVPDNYRKVVLEVDNDKIRKALEAGEELSFASLEPRGKHVEWR